ncbi:MAG: energy transducer TonB, partial [Fibrobacterota bacterium]
MKVKNKYTLNVTVILGVALINLVLFTLIPGLHALFGMNLDVGKGNNRQRVIAEFYKPKKPEPKKVEKKTRKVKTSTGEDNNRTMKFKFTPDLGVAGGEGAAIQSQDLQAVVFEEGETDEDVIPVFTPPISYPGKARDMGIEGTLEIVFVVTEEGKVGSVDIVRSPHQSFDREARKTIARWKFKPAKNDGVPVKVRVK